MENKEKQVEEIFNDIVEIADRPYYYDNKGHAHIDFVDLDKLAEKLSEKYQPKFLEDSVVLSKEEYSKNLQTHYYMGQREVEEEYKTIQIPKERKEIAEKAFEITKKIIDKKYAIETPWTRATLSNIVNQIEKEFAKQFGFEIKE